MNKKRIGEKLKDEEVFIENSTYSRQHLKKRIIKNCFIKYVCNDCGNSGKWNGDKLILHLEHINGVNDDNRLCNLTFLCPNCHSQTNTYAGKSKRKERIVKKCKCGEEIYRTSKMCVGCNSVKNRKVERPDLEDLLENIESVGYSATGRKYNVSDNTIRKWVKR